MPESLQYKFGWRASRAIQLCDRGPSWPESSTDIRQAPVSNNADGCQFSFFASNVERRLLFQRPDPLCAQCTAPGSAPSPGLFLLSRNASAISTSDTQDSSIYTSW